MSQGAKRTKSGQNPAVTAYRRKIDSISDSQSPALEALAKRAAKLERKLSPAAGIEAQEMATIPAPPPPAPPDPRRDGDSLVPIDVVDVDD